MRFSVRGALVALLLLLAPLLAGCEEQPQQAAATQAPPPGVTVVRAEVRDLRPSVNFSGRVTALLSPYAPAAESVDPDLYPGGFAPGGDPAALHEEEGRF